METYLKIIQDIAPNITANDIKLTFNEAGIDSIDMVTLRVEFERLIGKPIPDLQWMCFENLKEIIEYCSIQKSSTFLLKSDVAEKQQLNEITINMPQMAIEALSENWLFKELGNLHWQLLCDGLGIPSFDLKDELGNRLYATFVRINIQNNIPLNMFKENEKLKIDGSIRRYGHSMYFSDIILKSAKAEIKAKLMTSFSIRNDTDNTKLVKSQPCSTNNVNRLPPNRKRVTACRTFRCAAMTPFTFTGSYPTPIFSRRSGSSS